MPVIAKLVSVMMLLLLPALAEAQQAACPQSGPLSEAQLTKLVESPGAPVRWAQLVASCGIDFEPTADAIARLRSATAPETVLDAVRAATGPAERKRKSEQALWDFIKDSRDPQMFEQFLREYPAGQYAEEARMKLAALTPAAPPPFPATTAGRGGRGASPAPAAFPPGAQVYRTGGGVTPPTLIENTKVEPTYSEQARSARVEGTVALYIEVGPDGMAHNARVLRGLGAGLDEEAVAAVQRWRFTPGEKDGEPVTVQANVEVNFQLTAEPIAGLNSATGDLGIRSGPIATNPAELAALRKLGPRDYFEFRVKKTNSREGGFTMVGDIQVRLTMADPKKNTYTIDVMADGRVTEKRNREINQPLQFYSGRSTEPYELLVNQVQKDAITGYLSAPKAQTAR